MQFYKLQAACDAIEKAQHTGPVCIVANYEFRGRNRMLPNTFEKEFAGKDGGGAVRCIGIIAAR